MWLNKLFNSKKTKKLTKYEYFEKFQLIELFGLLHQAEEFMKLQNNSNPEFNQFKDDFIEEIYEIECDNVADFTRIWNWFKPDHEWNKATQNEGKALGDQIFKIMDYWKRNQDFDFKYINDDGTLKNDCE